MILDVSIILVNYNTKELTRNCLKSIFEKTIDLNFEVFVVDNNSQDDSVEMIEREFPQVKLIRNEKNLGFGAANNIAIKQSNAKYILCLNTDTILIDNAIKQFFDFMEKAENSSVGACGAYLYNDNNEFVNSYGPLPNFYNSSALYSIVNKIKNKLKLKKIYNNKLKNFEVHFITGADLFIRKSVLDEVGCFNEAFFMYAEDSDLCYRIRRNHYKLIILPYVHIIHLEGKSSSTNLMLKKHCITGCFTYHRLHSSILTILFIKASYIILFYILYLFTKKQEYLTACNYYIEA